MDKKYTIVKKRKIHIEFLRVFACYMVFFNHTDAAIRNVTAEDLTKSRLAALIIFFICKTAVPVFLMIAGANLKRKRDSIQKSISRVGKVMLLILGTSIFYHLYYYKSFSVQDFLDELISGKTTLTIWYLYLYLGIMILLPILQRIHFTRKMYLYIFALHLVGPGMLPVLEYYFDLNLVSNYLFMTEISSYVILFLLGDFLENELRIEELTLKNGLVAGSIMITSVITSLLLALYQIRADDDAFDSSLYNQTYFTPTILLAVTIYFLCRLFFVRIENNKIEIILTVTGSCTLGIYILSDFLRLELDFVSDYLKARMSQLLSVLLFDAILVCIGIIIMCIWKFVLGCLRKKRNG